MWLTVLCCIFCLSFTASCYSETWCYSGHISLAFPHSGSNYHTEPQVWNTSNFFELSTNFCPSSSYPPRAKACPLPQSCFKFIQTFCFLLLTIQWQDLFPGSFLTTLYFHDWTSRWSSVFFILERTSHHVSSYMWLLKELLGTQHFLKYWNVCIWRWVVFAGS
jgi:hypothetical protein